MRKWLIAGVALLFLCAAVVLAVLNLNSLINRNRDYLLGRAEEALGRKIRVGDMAITLWNGVGLRLENFALSDDPAFSSGDFVRARDLQVNVKLLPLLRKELQIKRAILHEPSIQIIRNREGRFNFSTIAKDKKQKEEEDEKERESDREKKRRAPVSSLVDISGGEVRYVDRKDGTDFVVKRVDFQAKDLDFDRPFSVTLSGALFAEKQNFEAQARVGPPPRRDFAGMPLEGKIDIDPIDFGKLKSAVPAVGAALPKDLDLSGIWKAKDVEFKGHIKKLAVRGTLEGTGGTLNFGKSLRKAPGIPFVFSADSQYASNTISFRSAQVKLNNLEIAGKGEVRWGDLSSVSLFLNSNKASLDGWERIIPALQGYELSGSVEIRTTVQGRMGKGATPQLQGSMTLTGVSAKPPQFPQPVKDLNAKINFTGQTAELTETTLSLGNSRMRLAARIDRFSPLTLSYRLSTPEVRPADFQAALPPERKSDVLKNFSSEGTLGAKNGTLAFQGKLASTQGTLYQINYRDLATGLLLENNVAHIRNLRVSALNGSVQADGEYGYKEPVPRFTFASKVQGIDLNEAYRVMDPKGRRDIRGRLNADMKVSGSGKGWEEIKPALRGQGQAEVLQGALLNFNIAEGVLSGITGVPGLSSFINPQVRKKYPETFEAKDTEFKELRGIFTLADTRMNVKELRMTAADYTVRGDGWVDFNRRVDFESVLILSERLSADLARSVREMRYVFNSRNQLEIPFSLTGTLPHVRPRPDTNYLAKLVQRGMIQRGAEEIQRRVFGTKPAPPPAAGEGDQIPESGSPEKKSDKKRNSTEDLIRKGLEGLFGR